MLYLKFFTTLIKFIFNNFQAQPSTSVSIVNNKRYLNVEDLFGNTDDINFEDEECKFLNICIIIIFYNT